MPNILEWFQSLPEYALLPAVGVMAFGEAIVGLGLILPGEAAVLFYSATVGSMPEFMLLWSVTASCIVAGSVVGFEIGRRSGPSLRDSRVVRRHGADRWDRATGLLRKHGVWAVFLGRLTPFVRSVVPAVAGAAGMPYRTFLPTICAGAICSSVLPILFVLAVGRGLRNGSAVVLVLLGVLLIGVVLLVRRSRRRTLSEPMATENIEPSEIDTPRWWH